jgi:Putative DNA-binding domain
MATRSIKDEEIALIKAMLARGMRNKDIQFHFNRPERPVNNGRITGIRKGTYSNSSEIPAASDDALEKFFASQRAPESAKIVPTEQEEVSPLSQTTLMKMFHQGGDGVWRLTAGETDCAECKENFQMKHSARWLRPMAALANNRGGYIFFGIKDQDAGGEAKHEVVGIGKR